MCHLDLDDCSPYVARVLEAWQNIYLAGGKVSRDPLLKPTDQARQLLVAPYTSPSYLCVAEFNVIEKLVFKMLYSLVLIEYDNGLGVGGTVGLMHQFHVRCLC